MYCAIFDLPNIDMPDKHKKYTAYETKSKDQRPYEILYEKYIHWIVLINILCKCNGAINGLL